MAHKLEDKDRRALDFHRSQVRENLPEYFMEDYPTFVKFLEAYYDFMDSDGASSFDTEIGNLNSIRDISETPTKYLDQVIAELGSSIKNGDLFVDPRFSARRFGDFYRTKGSERAIQEFFRAFFQSEVEIEYPKGNIFIVGEDRIGAESLRYIQDYRKYQLYSILLKVGLGVRTYRELYKKFVHPAGFYFEGEVSVVGLAENNFFYLNDSTDLYIEDEDVGAKLVTEVFAEAALLSSITGITDSIDGDGPIVRSIRTDIDRNYINLYQTLTIEELNRYFDIKSLVSPNSPKFDDSANIARPDFASEYDNFRFDQNVFGRYNTDSAY